jgi:hypothetical protein
MKVFRLRLSFALLAPTLKAEIGDVRQSLSVPHRHGSQDQEGDDRELMGRVFRRFRFGRPSIGD